MQARTSKKPVEQPRSSQYTDDALKTVLETLDVMDAEVTDFEASVLDTVMKQQTWASWKQRKVLAQMVERYLDNPTLAAELLGQQRLWL